MFENKKILITGGTGTFGKECVKQLLRDHEPEKVYVFSRDEYKQHQLKNKYPGNKKLAFFLGDIRDKSRLFMAFRDIDYVIHAAALKQVPSCEFNPFETIQTNIIGAQNIIDASIERGVKNVIALSTDKAVNPINLYGTTKLCMEKVFLTGNNYVGQLDTKFSICRYGNVLGSRGSLIEILLNKKKNKDTIVELTDPDMTRFFIKIEDAVKFVLCCFKIQEGREVFIPRMNAYKISVLISQLYEEALIKVTGIRPGEKIHEILISEEEKKNTYFTRYFKDIDTYIIKDEKPKDIHTEKIIYNDFDASSNNENLSGCYIDKNDNETDYYNYILEGIKNINEE